MNMPEQARLMARYNRWMNQRLYDHCRALSDEQRKNNMGAFFKSIHGTLNHILVADRIWMARFTGQPAPYSALDVEAYADFDALWRAREQEDEKISAWAGTLTSAMLEQDLHYTGIVDPRPKVMPHAIAVTHFFNHQTHHRGQVTTLLMQLGIDPGVTDLIGMPDVTTPA